MLSDPYGSAETPWMSVIAAKLRRLIYGDFFIYRNRMKIHKKDCLGKRQPSLKPVNLAGYRRRTAIWFKKEKGNPGILRKKEITLSREEEGTREDRRVIG